MKYLVLFVVIGLLVFEISAFSLRLESHEDDRHKSKEYSSHEKKPAAKSSRKRYSDRSDDSSESSEDTPPQKSLAIGLNTGEGDGKKSEGVNRLIEVVKDLVARVNKEPLFRAKKFDFEESTGVNAKKRGKSSVGIELDAPTLLNFVKKVISSRKFKKATDDLARKAAVIFRALKESN